MVGYICLLKRGRVRKTHRSGVGCVKRTAESAEHAEIEDDKEPLSNAHDRYVHRKR